MAVAIARGMKVTLWTVFSNEKSGIRFSCSIFAVRQGF
jgi:hypothetical protein